jgi:hypothetical protein
VEKEQKTILSTFSFYYRNLFALHVYDWADPTGQLSLSSFLSSLLYPFFQMSKGRY